MRAMRPVVTLTARKRVSCALITSVDIVTRRFGVGSVARASTCAGEISARGRLWKTIFLCADEQMDVCGRVRSSQCASID